MKKSNARTILLGSLFLFFVSCTEKNEIFNEHTDVFKQTESTLKAGVYKNKLEYVVGDVKQVLINNKLKENQIKNLLDGFEEMKFNAVRIPIYATGVNPNQKVYDKFYNEAKSRGFKIFANPALGYGGQRIATKKLHCPDHELPKVLGKTKYKNELVKRIKGFAKSKKCTWICPFNEDEGPGKTWNNIQMNNIFKELDGNLNGAKLIGPCTWGIPAGIDVLKKTDIKKYISVATTHNLGFHNDKWGAFKKAAGNLKIWDSETNKNKKYPNKATRIDAAVSNGVHGIVVYDAWKSINLNNGSVKTSGKDYMKLYLK